MSIQSVKKELEALKKEVAPSFKTIEELLKVSDIRTLTDQELFRLLQNHEQNLTSLEDLTTEVLEQMVKGEYP
jgi:hypothetical protein